jgi:hypothetical protein
MLSSLIYPFIDSLPSPFSSKIVELSRKIDIWKLVMTDDLWAPALREFIRKDYEKNFSDDDLEKIFSYAFLAGVDGLMILYPAKVPILYKTIEKIINEHPELIPRLDSSVVRNLLLKNKAYPYMMESIYYSTFHSKRILVAEKCQYLDTLLNDANKFRFNGVVINLDQCKKEISSLSRKLKQKNLIVFIKFSPKIPKFLKLFGFLNEEKFIQKTLENLEYDGLYEDFEEWKNYYKVLTKFTNNKLLIFYSDSINFDHSYSIALKMKEIKVKNDAFPIINYKDIEDEFVADSLGYEYIFINF